MKKLIFSLLILPLAGVIVTVLFFFLSLAGSFENAELDASDYGGNFKNATFDASSEKAFKVAIQAIDMGLTDNESREFRRALLFYIDGCGPGGKRKTSFSPENSCGLDRPDLVLIGGLGKRGKDNEGFTGSTVIRIGLSSQAKDNLTAIDGLRGEQILEKYREDLKNFHEHQE